MHPPKTNLCMHVCGESVCSLTVRCCFSIDECSLSGMLLHQQATELKKAQIKRLDGVLLFWPGSVPASLITVCGHYLLNLLFPFCTYFLSPFFRVLLDEQAFR